MNESPWPLSAAASQLLIDSSETAPAATTNSTLAKLAIKELVLRGHLRVIQVRRRRMRTPAVSVATAGPGTPPPLAGTPAFISGHLPPTDGEDLAALLRRARKGKPYLYADQLRGAAYGELQRYGFIEPRYRKILGFWPSSFQALTPAGVAARKRVAADRDDARGLWYRLDTDLAGTAQSLTSLGILVLLLADGLALTATVARRWSETAAGHVLVGAGVVDDVDPGFNVLTACLERLGDGLEGARDFGGLDAAIDVISSALDRGTVDGTSPGGGSNGCGSSSGCGGGGGCGGGCGGGS